MLLTLEIRDLQIWRHIDGRSDALPDSRKVGHVSILDNWTRRYAKAVEVGDQSSILLVGREMLAWLDVGGALAGWLDANRRGLEILGAGVGEVTDALLAAPWEVLADDNGFLAEDRMKVFLPRRRVATDTTSVTPDHADLAMLFMAAAPEGQHELDYEAEEAAILDATRSRSTGQPLLHLTVEESGELEVLAERHKTDGLFDILHLSCHGDIQKLDGETRPVLLLETEKGVGDTVTPDRLLGALGERVPPLLFLSACRTGQRGRASGAPTPEGRREGSAEAPRVFADHPRREAGPTVAPDLAEPLARQMAAGVPHVLGWDGSVYDADAAAFAEALYAGLGRGETVAYAAAKARHAVMEATDRGAPGQHWHLARVYLGPGGGGALCDRAKPARPAPPPAAPRFLDADKKVRVAGRNEFVGRRRQLQRLRRGFAGEATGALVHGLGDLGKSSLAARLADRMTGHQLAVIVEKYDGLSILAELERVATPLLGRVFASFAEQAAFKTEFDAMREAVRHDEAMLGEVLRFLFDGVFAGHPLLLVIDDFERALEDPAPGVSLVASRPALRPALTALLGAFAAHHGLSRLLITSRYDFTLPDGSGDDLAAGLIRVPLVGMRSRERQKQWRAKARAENAEAATGGDTARLVAAALEAAAGNPGLQDVLTRPILKGEEAAARAAVQAVTTWRETRTVPEDGNEALAFFARMTFDKYEKALTETERTVLAAACVFEAEVPRGAVAAAAGSLGVADPDAALDRLLALGLLDDFGPMSGWHGMTEVPHLAANPLARPLAPVLPVDLAAAAADAALPELARAWRDTEGDFPVDPRGPAACRLALRATAPDPEVLEAAALAAVLHLFQRLGLAPAALALAEPALERLAEVGHDPGHQLSGHTINAARQAGDVALQAQLLEQALRSNSLDRVARAKLLGLRGDLLQARGDLDAALRIRTEDLLPVYEALGDKRLLAVTKGKIADVLQARGDLDEALRIRTEDLLPVFEALGDKRSLAVTKGTIADVLQARGDLDEALRIRTEEELPVFEALGDKRSLAVTKGKIADVLEARGDLDEALRIRTEEELPVYEALGDKRSLAVTKGTIADVLQARGDLDEALRIRIEEELPVYEALGDKRSLAVTKGKIADVLEARGDLDAALRIRTEDLLPVFEALADKRELAVTKGKIADVLAAKGNINAALDMHLSRLPDAKAMGYLDSLVHIRFSCARLRLDRGDHQREGLQTIAGELAEAWAGANQLGRPDAIGAIGSLFGQVLAGSGLPDQGIAVLTDAAHAWDKLGQAEQADHCRQIIASIKEQHP
ncbi:CHAT domain-containing protein [Sagittula sp. NFXS13]|uniref:CHAT domain-containing protein n=1 Tax=Sagittula sp. NFXS13 TaxID=2819095 RepID=UPI0032DF6009